MEYPIVLSDDQTTDVSAQSYPGITGLNYGMEWASLNHRCVFNL